MIKHYFWIILCCGLLSITHITWAQDSTDTITSAYDFWVGNWNATWTNADGSIGKGTNYIHKTLDDKVIQENFKITDSGTQTGFSGMSISVYNPQLKTWHQAWADNQGGYYDLIGEIDGDVRIFKTHPRTLKDGRILQQRMRFYNIQKNAFSWDWESSFDGGETWKLSWRIAYERADVD